MAVLYRAIWSDAEQELITRARETFCAWARMKSDDLLLANQPGEELTEDGSFVFRLAQPGPELETGPVTAVVQASLVEIKPNGSRWTTTVRAWTGNLPREETHRTDGWIWVDVDAVAHDSLEGVVVAAPTFVRELLDQGEHPNRRDVPVTVSPRFYEGEDGAELLAELLTNIDRDLPVAVFAPPPDWFDNRSLPSGRSVSEMYDGALTFAARMTAGMALVCKLDEAGTLHLATAIGESYSVHDGAFRLYLPGLDPALAQEWRHRYVLLPRYIKDRTTAGKLIGRAISLAAGARRAPDSYDVAARLLESSRLAEPVELLTLLEMGDEEISQQRERIADLDQMYLNILEDQQQLTEENNKLREQLHVARRKLAIVEPALWQSQPESMTKIEESRLPTSADSPSHAAWLAQVHLSDYLNLPDRACVDLADIDSRIEARAWADTSWRAFRALHAYAKDVADGSFAGSFWVWCESSGNPLAWPATPKKLAMKESETVTRNKQLFARRVFPVDRRISGSGKIAMEAHIKIAEGGGPLAPRIYFVHSRDTAMVHVGYFGPHRNLPNTLT